MKHCRWCLHRWNERLASDSEAAVKAEKVGGSPEELVSPCTSCLLDLCSAVVPSCRQTSACQAHVFWACRWSTLCAISRKAAQMPALQANLTPRSRAKPSLAQAALGLTNRHEVST